jgi:hypothetical protein
MAKITERGWPGHYCCAEACRFRRNTLVEGKLGRVVVSTVGDEHTNTEGKTRPQHIGAGVVHRQWRWYETMVFCVEKRGSYFVADGGDNLEEHDLPWAIEADCAEDLPLDVDNIADHIHESIVAWYAGWLDR